MSEHQKPKIDPLTDTELAELLYELRELLGANGLVKLRNGLDAIVAELAAVKRERDEIFTALLTETSAARSMWKRARCVSCSSTRIGVDVESVND